MIALRRPPATHRFARIYGVGAYHPRRVVPNDELAPGASADWIRHLTGISRRRRAGDTESLVEMSVAAASDALEAGGIPARDVQCVIVASATGPHQTPTVAATVAQRLGARAAGAFDISTACTGFCYALAVAGDLVRAASARHVVVIGTERTSDLVDPADPEQAGYLFGDGTGALVVGPASTPGIGPVAWGCDDGFVPGRRLFRWAADTLVGVARRSLAAAGVTAGDLDAFIPHQANDRLIDAWVRALDLPDRVTVARSVREHGCTAAASIPLAMHDLLSTGRARPGGLALLLGYGSGLTYAAQVVRLPAPPARSTPPGGHPWTGEELLRRVEAAVAAVGDPGTVGGTDAPRVRWETRFDTDLGGDTLFLAEVVGELEGELGIRLPDESLHGVRTAGDLVERVREQLAAEQLGAL